MTRRSIATISLHGTLSEKLDAIAAAGFDAVEMFAGDLGEGADLPAIRRQLDALGLAVDLFQPLRDAEGVDDRRFADTLVRAEQAFDAMQALGAPLLLICSNTIDVIADDARAADQLARIADRAEARGLQIGYEALAWGGSVATWEHAWRIVEQADHPALGLILDSFHVQVRPEAWKGIANLPGDRIAFVQIGDAPIVDADYMTWRRTCSTLPGRGELDVVGFARAVRTAGYAGPLSLEIFNLLDRTPAVQRATDAIASLDWLDRMLAAHGANQ